MICDCCGAKGEKLIRSKFIDWTVWVCRVCLPSFREGWIIPRSEDGGASLLPKEIIE